MDNFITKKKIFLAKFFYKKTQVRNGILLSYKIYVHTGKYGRVVWINKTYHNILQFLYK
jgi:hypothetical protein